MFSSRRIKALLNCGCSLAVRLSFILVIYNRTMAAGSQYFDEAHDADVPKEIRPTLQLLVKCHLPPDAFRWPHEKIISALNAITHVRLDRENIAYIDNFELLGECVTNLYLQKNQIETIENLECLRGLQFLTLGANRIRKIEGLTRLPKLGFLDLSENLIEHFDIDELPQTLIILDLRGNPCTQLDDYRGSIIQDIEKLQQLDGETVTKEEKRDAGYVVSSDSEEDDVGTNDIGMAKAGTPLTNPALF